MNNMNQTINNAKTVLADALCSLASSIGHDEKAFIPQEGDYTTRSEIDNSGFILDVANDITDLRIAISMALASKSFRLYEQNFRKSKKARAITKSIRKKINKEKSNVAA